MPSSYLWIQDLVRCPTDMVRLNPINASTMFMLDAGASPSSSSSSESLHLKHIRQHLLDFENGGSTADVGDFSNSTTNFITMALAVEALVYLLLIASQFHGLQLLTASSVGSRVAKKRVDPLTTNLMWLAYFGAQLAMHVLAILAIEVQSWHQDAEIQRVLILLQRVCLGFTSLLLVTALNDHRLDKIRDYAKSAPSSALKRQARQLNIIAIGIFFVCTVTYFVSSHIVDDSSSVASAMYWIYITSLVIIMIPPMLATFWISFHEAEMQPSRTAKGVLLVAVVVRLLTIYPPSLWNDHVLQSWVDRNPCPVAGKLSFYDCLLVMHFVSNTLLLVFIALEHRRNAKTCLSEYYAQMSQQLEVAINSSEMGSAAPTPSSTSGGGRRERYAS